MAVELRWVLPEHTTTDKPRLQYRQCGEWPAAWGAWQDVPIIVVPQDLPSMPRQVPLQQLQLSAQRDGLLAATQVEDKLADERPQFRVGEIGVVVSEHDIQDGQAEFNVHGAHGTPAGMAPCGNTPYDEGPFSIPPDLKEVANAAYAEVMGGIEAGRKAQREGQSRDAMTTDSERIGWDEAAHDAGVVGDGSGPLVIDFPAPGLLVGARLERQWQPIATAPRDKNAWFWIRPKTAEETYVDTSNRPIVSPGEARAEYTKYGRWSSLWTATHWMPNDPPPAPKDGVQGTLAGQRQEGGDVS